MLFLAISVGYSFNKSMARLVLFLSLLLLSVETKAAENFYLGAALGHNSLNENSAGLYTPGLGLGAFIGLKPSALLDASFHLQGSYHAGGSSNLTVLAPHIAFDFMLLKMSEIEGYFGFGPGLYLLNRPSSSSTLFGLHAGGKLDVVLDDHLRIGLFLRLHKVLDASSVIGGILTIGAAATYLF